MDEQSFSAAGREIYTVSRLNAEARSLLEGTFPLLWVEGEISNLARPASGHWYFSLKDAAAQVRCAMFRGRNRLQPFALENGMHVLARTAVSLYEARGEYQLIVEELEAAGDGALLRACEQLKQRLAAEGLFDAARKRPIPALPRRIGVVTSPTGAAVRDVLTVLARRFPAIPVLIYPVPVQGREAAGAIARMIGLAGRRAECDVLILARGGGSLEDLWAFNEESVARAIAASPIPIVTGIGHEIDVTIADFAADLRAPTPSGAAELVSPDRSEWRQSLHALEGRLAHLTRGHLARLRQTLGALEKRLEQQHPGQRLRQRVQRLDELERRLARGMAATLRRDRARLGERIALLLRHVPLHRIERQRAEYRHLAQRLAAAAARRLERGRERLAALGRALEAVSPLATLGRGYAIVRRLPDGALLRDARAVAPGAQVEARLAKGRLLCDVRETHED